MDFDPVSARSINTQKPQGPYPAILTAQAWSIKYLLHGKGTVFSCGTQRVGKRPSARSGSQSQRMMRFISPANVGSHIIDLFLALAWTELLEGNHK